MKIMLANFLNFTRWVEDWRRITSNIGRRYWTMMESIENNV